MRLERFLELRVPLSLICKFTRWLSSFSSIPRYLRNREPKFSAFTVFHILGRNPKVSPLSSFFFPSFLTRYENADARARHDSSELWIHDEKHGRYIVEYIHARGKLEDRLYPAGTARSRVHTPKCHKYLLSGERIWLFSERA